MATNFKRYAFESLSVFVLLIVLVGFFESGVHKVVPGNAPLGEFSAVHAISHLKYIAAKPLLWER